MATAATTSNANSSHQRRSDAWGAALIGTEIGAFLPVLASTARRAEGDSSEAGSISISGHDADTGAAGRDSYGVSISLEGLRSSGGAAFSSDAGSWLPTGTLGGAGNFETSPASLPSGEAPPGGRAVIVE